LRCRADGFPRGDADHFKWLDVLPRNAILGDDVHGVGEGERRAVRGADLDATYWVARTRAKRVGMPGESGASPAGRPSLRA